MPETDGPCLQTAVICEKVLQEQDGAVSAFRIIDRIFLPNWTFGKKRDGAVAAVVNVNCGDGGVH
jgi:hypothetical protein